MASSLMSGKTRKLEQGIQSAGQNGEILEVQVIVGKQESDSYY